MFMSMFGIGSIICYLLGGIVAMKVSDKIYTIIGDILDKTPGAAGYQTVYWLAAACAVGGAICAVAAVRIIKKNKAIEEEQ